MSNNGNPKLEYNLPDEVVSTPVDGANIDEEVSRWQTLPFLIVIAVALGVAAVLGFQLMGILYAMLFPPNVTLPPDVTELEHENFTYGADRWVYGTSMNGCMLVEYFQSNGAICEVASGFCGGVDTEVNSPNIQELATCSGDETFSIFGMRWQATISAHYSSEPITRFELTRDVLWFGLPSGESLAEATQTVP